ncbi:hypothetical protein D3C81_1235860 [compost metagenome]
MSGGPRTNSRCGDYVRIWRVFYAVYFPSLHASGKARHVQFHPRYRHRQGGDLSAHRHCPRGQQPQRILSGTGSAGTGGAPGRVLPRCVRCHQAPGGALSHLRPECRWRGGGRIERKQCRHRVGRHPGQHESGVVPVPDRARHSRGACHSALFPAQHGRHRPRAIVHHAGRAQDQRQRTAGRGLRQRQLPGHARLPGRIAHGRHGTADRAGRPWQVGLVEWRARHHLRQQRRLA